MVSLGCPKNLTDSETDLGILASAGYIVTPSLQDAEIILINTCSFIRTAVRESLDEIFRCAQFKKRGSCRWLVVIGCLPQRYKRKLEKLIPEVDVWMGVNARPYLLDALNRASEGELTADTKYGNSFIRTPENTGEQIQPRLLSTPPYTAYLKIAEGCSHACSYCLIPRLRGSLRSRPLEVIYQEASQLVANGAREINLVAQDTGSYGKDLYGRASLDIVIRRLAGLAKLKWLRILYLNPASLTDKLLTAIQEEQKVCRYLDLPFQHASGKVLRRMNRRGDLAGNLQVVADLRNLLPGIALRTTLMTGFPGEDKAAFRELLSFVKFARFERVGVFTYSHEEGARSYSEQETASFVDKHRRRRQLLLVQSQIARETNRSFIGKEMPVLIERQLGQGVYVGRSYREAPEIDPKIIVKGDKLSPGTFARVKITHAYTLDLAGVSIGD